MDPTSFRLLSVSWIDLPSLPKVGFQTVAGALTKWPNRVLMGLVGTANPRPPERIADRDAFVRTKQFRALVECTVDLRSKNVTQSVIDPGYTPPFDKSRIDTILRSVAPIPSDPDFYAGESSATSGVVTGKLHPSSTLKLGRDYSVIASAMIKFRAGPHTDQIGIAEANSPVHVPWVWCEFALIRCSTGYRLLGNGSTFPSHAWYVDGAQLTRTLQGAVSCSEHDAALNTGQPKAQPQSSAKADKSTGAADKQLFAIGAGVAFDLPIPATGK